MFYVVISIFLFSFGGARREGEKRGRKKKRIEGGESKIKPLTASNLLRIKSPS